MTVAAQLALRGHRMEYFLCIEGVGWPTDENDISQGFDGDVWATDDFNGDLASILGCTVHGGLEVTGTISDSIDAVTAKYQAGSMSFLIVPQDDWWANNFTPHLTDQTTTQLTSSEPYTDTTIRLADGTDFANGDVAFGDILQVISNWGPCSGCPQDVDGNGTVGFSDILGIVATWGPCS